MALRQFHTSALRMFWDAAWRREKWPVVLRTNIILDGSPMARHQLCPASSPMTTVQGRMVQEVTKPL